MRADAAPADPAPRAPSPCRRRCNYAVIWPTHHACPSRFGSHSLGWWVRCLFLAAGAYIALGTALNIRRTSTLSWSAVPHPHLWSALAGGCSGAASAALRAWSALAWRMRCLGLALAAIRGKAGRKKGAEYSSLLDAHYGGANGAAGSGDGVYCGRADSPGPQHASGTPSAAGSSADPRDSVRIDRFPMKHETPI